jgi:phage replication O-like protein O
MADVQVENGYTKIANELLEVFCRFNLSAYESRVIWAIIRLTHGWRESSRKITLSEMINATGLKSRHVSRSIRSLTDKNMILRNGVTGIQKDYEKWVQTPPIKGVPIQVDAPIQAVPKEVEQTPPIQVEKSPPIQVHHLLVKERKETKESGNEVKPVPDIRSEQFERIWAKYPRREGKKEAQRHFNATVKSEQNWSEIKIALARYLKQIDGRELRYVKQGSTWFNNWRDYVQPVQDEAFDG